MVDQSNRYVFRFIHVQAARGWSVRDTLNDRTFGSYASEDEAVAAALLETSRHSAQQYSDAAAAAVLLR